MRLAAEPIRSFPEDRYPLQELTGRIIGAFLDVHRVLGFGFLESTYRRALAVELEYRSISVAREVPYEMLHRSVSVGTDRADIVVASMVILEVKAGLLLDPVAPVQLLNYLKVSRLPVGLVLHFGPRPGIKRVVEARGTVENIRSS